MVVFIMNTETINVSLRLTVVIPIHNSYTYNTAL
jgi:hypothetical protein